ncbi:HPr family phosphocarrier protein [Ammoniphilus sp. CFH 90114]|uniref:HPr family phosphocarrier protein n=1 Tax=Ammoniphilus sp. CFH 90114 TaxID=2493665 RepID=UPI00100DF859|nr:HPr family phosphocarrier protein [Ammoniphilus sp. CFH 90114]RXT06547.1 HPr family phosphocarrier protein [Ammoniphilus sp. CFH 90114]
MTTDIILQKSAPYRLLEEIAVQSSAFESEIYLMKGNFKANAKNLIDLITLSLHPFDHLFLIIEGTDSNEAQEKIVKLLN